MEGSTPAIAGGIFRLCRHCRHEIRARKGERGRLCPSRGRVGDFVVVEILKSHSLRKYPPLPPLCIGTHSRGKVPDFQVAECLDDFRGAARNELASGGKWLCGDATTERRRRLCTAVVRDPVRASFWRGPGFFWELVGHALSYLPLPPPDCSRQCRQCRKIPAR